MPAYSLTEERGLLLPRLVPRADAEPATIALQPGVYRVSGLVSVGTLAIWGVGGAGNTVLVADPPGRLWSIAGGSLMLRGVTLRGGVAPSGGALELVNDAKVLIEECWFEGNRAVRERGGAIAVSDSASLELSRCRLIGDHAPWGGAIAVVGEATARIDHCSFRENQARCGGALFCDQTAQVEVVASSFLNNAAKEGPIGGGALLVIGGATNGPEVRVARSVFVGDYPIVRDPEGAGSLVISGCTVPPGALAAVDHEGDGNVEFTDPAAVPAPEED